MGLKMNMYKIIVDYGKPYEDFLNQEQLKQKLKDLRELANSGDFAYFDLEVYVIENENICKKLTEEEINKIEEEVLK